MKHHLYILIWIASLVLIQAHGDIHERIVKVSIKITESPTSSELFTDRARLYLEHNNPEKALLDLKAAQEISPDNKEITHLTAASYNKLSKFQASLKITKELIKNYPTSQEAHLLSAVAYSNLNQAKAASTHYETYLKLDPRASLSVHIQYIQELKKLSQIPPIDKAYKNALETFGNAPTLLAGYAEWLVNSNRPELAAKQYHELRQANPNLAFHWWVQELILWKKFNPQKASEARLQAHKAWGKLSQKIRQRDAMQQKHLQFLKL